MFKSLIAIMEGTKAALMAIKANAMRSALTCLGIIIGVAAVITVVAVMQGFTKQINDQLADMAPDVTSIKPYTSVEQEMVGVKSKLTYDDFLVLKSKIKEAETMTALMFTWRFSGGAQYGNKTHNTRVMGTEQDYQKAYRTYPDKGRFIRAEDDEKRRRVAFIGASVIDKLNLPKNPVGEYIKLGGEWFRIIGVSETQGSFLGFDQDDYINIPISTMSALEGANSASNVQIMFRLQPEANEEQVMAQITRILRQRHKIKDGQENDFEFETAEKARANVDKFTGSATAITAGIVGISLIVGGIGVMNIMLVSVTERTRVIGTLKALGATPGFIMLQFLVEAVVLSLFGGLIGLALGYGMAATISAILPGMPDAYIPGWAIMLSFGFTSMIGIVFGLAPAIKAARLNPIDALRYE
ncbi:putative ABC transport system permease protein [Pseudoalteromonas ulvae UL12]|uniref:ABC transporter permease n=1 Tax=Pseudoalteromonas ulvae TaxID=107327 RepID=UPI00186B7A21|nr:ABC transporter permease [Pseudoalteromonas ulvae]MBE0361974.1 putative ABC transport system permease protein [Pseudoalteromonas ulvae UL12]